jgi:hypothetical protein
MSRKGAKPHKRPAKPNATQNADAETFSVLPMEIQIGDRFTDAEGEWEVVSHPATLHGAKSLRARLGRAAHGLRRPRLARELLPGRNRALHRRRLGLGADAVAGGPASGVDSAPAPERA